MNYVSPFRYTLSQLHLFKYVHTTSILICQGEDFVPMAFHPLLRCYQAVLFKQLSLTRNGRPRVSLTSCLRTAPLERPISYLHSNIVIHVCFDPPELYSSSIIDLEIKHPNSITIKGSFFYLSFFSVIKNTLTLQQHEQMPNPPTNTQIHQSNTMISLASWVQNPFLPYEMFKPIISYCDIIVNTAL